MTEETHKEMADLLTRDDAHLTELTVNRYLARELAPELAAFVDEHLAGCAACGDRLSAVRTFDSEFSIAPPAALGAAPEAEVVSLQTERAQRRPTLAIFGLLAAAAAVALFLNFGGDQPARIVSGDDEIRFKGAGLELEVFAKADDGSSRLVGDGDVVHPGDRLGFKVKSRSDGFMMIVGVDDAGQVYAGWPQHSGGKAEFAPGQDEARDLESAVRLDGVGTQEKIVLVHCEQAFDLGQVTKHLVGAASLRTQPTQDPLAGCVYDDVTLKKKAR